MKILVTGGCGFIMSNFIRHVLKNYPDVEKIINLDKLTYAGNPDNLKDVENDPRYTFVQGDICDAELVSKLVSQVDCVINAAAETHVDRSIHVGSRDFVMTNTVGVQTILDAVRRNPQIKKMVNVSTDEVYGSLGLDETRSWTEESPVEPNVPYAAAKAGGDLLCRAYFKTFNVPVVVTHCSNNYGPYQFPEKLIPFAILRVLNDQPIPLYGDGKHVRDWLFVVDHCEALMQLLMKGKPGEIYNITGNCEKPNIEIAKFILKTLGKPETMIEFVKDRPGHDRRYSMHADKIRNEIGWAPRYNFEEALTTTIHWYVKNQEWVSRLQKRNTEINAHIEGKKHA